MQIQVYSFLKLYWAFWVLGGVSGITQTLGTAALQNLKLLLCLKGSFLCPSVCSGRYAAKHQGGATRAAKEMHMGCGPLGSVVFKSGFGVQA